MVRGERVLNIQTTEDFDKWLRKLRDLQAKMRIVRYFERIQTGDEITGDYKLVRPKIIEVRFDFGHGYRVYLTQEGSELVLLLVGGDKSTQSRDIDKAERLAKEWREGRGNEDKRI